jgi:hypothetical protein
MRLACGENAEHCAHYDALQLFHSLPGSLESTTPLFFSCVWTASKPVAVLFSSWLEAFWRKWVAMLLGTEQRHAPGAADC